MQIASYGMWNSPITAQKIAEGSKTIMNMMVDSDFIYWTELRPQNKGRYTIVRRSPNGAEVDMTPADFNVRTFVHEYGGGAFTVKDDVIYASNAADHAVYTIKHDKIPVRLTVAEGLRFADLVYTPHGLLAIVEQHLPSKSVENFLGLIDFNTGACRKIASGQDFYASPAVSPDGKQLAWVSWNLPEMPWTNSELWKGELGPQGLTTIRKIVGNGAESILQPEWSPSSELYFISDRDSGWWNLHRYADNNIENAAPMQAEIGEPLWVFGRTSYAFIGEKILFASNANSRWQLNLLDSKTKQLQKINRDSLSIRQLRAGTKGIYFIEGYETKGESISLIDDKTPPHLTTIVEAEKQFDTGYYSSPQHIAFPSAGRSAYGNFYAPRNKDYQAPKDEKPPLVVMIHGGPTAQAKFALQLAIQFWTSRGFAVFDVNYGGSTGYGRKYRELLNGNWGIVDVQDCENGALYLAQKGLVDPQKLVIRGGSAGGYTTLAALAFRNTFKAGGNYFGVADITALANDTHKFESRYMDILVGKYPEERSLWEERSPINSVDKIQSPLIIFQGANDAIVPKSQSIMIYEALKRRGVPVEIHIYEGEEHGFRQAANIIHSLQREVDFYLEIFGAKTKENSNA